ncbi:MAG: thiamine pyrophosphate-binding protein [Thermoguttaceae bacterium]|nr:thiamine pyrophosphate-binding protein [Thermoguttaceae bacterium]
MRVADYIFKTLADHGAKHVFLVTGGGAMHLNDAVGREKRLQYICNLHEQGCAIAAEGYARVSNTPGIINVTTGPGGTNALTGVMGAWVDSIPMIVISGQVKTSTTISACPELGLRSLGDQEINIVDLARPVTKYAVMVRRAEEIRWILEKAIYEASHGRPGPVWIDVPLDIQAAEISPDSLTGFTPPERDIPPVSSDQLAEVVKRLRQSKRPVMIVGNGIRLAGVQETFSQLAESLGIPVLTAISGVDLIASDSPLFFGRPGILGERAANFIMQNSDLLLVLGTRMSIRIIGYAYETVARDAYRIMVDADAGELSKPTFRVDCKIHADLGEWIPRLRELHPDITVPHDWLDYCRRVKRQYPAILPKHRERTDYVSSYLFPELIGQHVSNDAIIVTGNGTAYTSTFQAIPLRKGVRMFSNVACASMGYDLPAAIGAAFAGGSGDGHDGRPVILITGDGSLQMNLQELQTVLNYALPIKIFVYNNDGYLSIKWTQRSFFGGHFVGSTPASGVRLPDLSKLAVAYGFPYFRLENNTQATAELPSILSIRGPVICEVMTDPMEELGPKAASKRLPDGRMVSKPLEDLFPFLDREEFLNHMKIAPVTEE